MVSHAVKTYCASRGDVMVSHAVITYCPSRGDVMVFYINIILDHVVLCSKVPGCSLYCETSIHQIRTLPHVGAVSV